MNKHLEQLIDLAAVDKKIDAFEPQIEEAKHQYEALLARKESLVSDEETLRNIIRDEELKKQKNELHLAELSAKLEDNSRKSGDVKTEREMKSLQLEEEIAKEQVSFANEEIERLDRIIEANHEKVAAITEQLNAVDGEIETTKTEMDGKVSEIEKVRQGVFAEKEKLIAQMNQKGLAFYQKIRRWAKNTTAVPVKNQACMGCFMVISDKVYADVIKGEEITTCPHCGRILYLEQVAAEA